MECRKLPAREQMAAAKEAGHPITFDAAIEEVVAAIEAEEKKVKEIRKEIRALSKDKHANAKRIQELRQEEVKSVKRIDLYDEKLLRMLIIFVYVSSLRTKLHTAWQLVGGSLIPMAVLCVIHLICSFAM